MNYQFWLYNSQNNHFPREDWFLSIFSAFRTTVRRTRHAARAYVQYVIWGVLRQLPQRAAREPQIVQFLTYVYDTKMYFKKLFDKRFRRIFSSAFQWCRQFFRNFPFWPSKTLSHSISNRKHFGHSLGNILFYVKNAQLSI